MAGIRKKVYKNKKGVEIIKYYVVYKDIKGKQCSGGVGYDTKAEARKHLEEYEDLKVEGDITLGYIFELFKKRMKKYAKTTRELYEMYYEKYFKEISDAKYKRITGIFLQDIFDNIEKDSPYIAIICMKMWKSATNNAIKKHLIRTNKFNEVDTIKAPKAEINHLTGQEILNLLELAKENFCKKYFVMLYTLVGTGMREGELLALQKSDVDLKELTININKQYTHKELKNMPKTQSSVRKIHIFPDLAECLRDYMSEVSGELLFPSMTGGYINIDNFRRRFWTSLKEMANITKRVRLHDLRGSYIDFILSSGLSPKFAQNQVGHARNSTTMDGYAKNNQDMINKAEEKINDFFKLGGKTVEKFSKTENNNVILFSDILAKRNKKSPIEDF